MPNDWLKTLWIHCYKFIQTQTHQKSSKSQYVGPKQLKNLNIKQPEPRTYKKRAQPNKENTTHMHNLVKVKMCE